MTKVVFEQMLKDYIDMKVNELTDKKIKELENHLNEHIKEKKEKQNTENFQLSDTFSIFTK